MISYPGLASLLPLFTTVLWVRSPETRVEVKTSGWKSEYDYIVIGGGSAGAVVAARLSELSDQQVLLMEAGGTENVLSDIPLAAGTLQMSPIDWSYQTEPQKNSCFGLVNRRSRWPRGRVLGGSSVLNYMLYVRGNARDYDNWEKKGAFGWSYRDVLPYFMKSEDNTDTRMLTNGYHGRGGPLTVSSLSDPTELGRIDNEEKVMKRIRPVIFQALRERIELRTNGGVAVRQQLSNDVKIFAPDCISVAHATSG